MPVLPHLASRGVRAALAAALLFGAGTPLAKLLLRDIDPWMLAGLLYLGSGLGLALYRLILPVLRVRLAPAECAWFAAAVLAGGVVAPVLLMSGLAGMPAAGASLLLNAEAVFTALLAWAVFHEGVDRRIALGMLAIVGGALVLSWPAEGSGAVAGFGGSAPTLLVLGACLGWAIDNNLTRRVSLADPTWIASVKGLAAGTVNLGIALAMGAAPPAPIAALAAMGVGLFAYGASLALFVVGLRELGTARTGAYFGIAPFFGAALAVMLGEPLTAALVTAGGLMAVGVWLHLTERHAHEHLHEAITHDHLHVHDAHHRHSHDFDWDGSEPHRHVHSHEPLRHTHPHFPDAHHRHRHS
ncbi:MAG: EamA family transporter [Proteobacteria bacterium]|nr:EamA family transporter [Pseudomonadota bacterium]